MLFLIEKTIIVTLRTAMLITCYKKTLILMFLTEVSQTKLQCWIYAYLTN